jgi:DUF971 family protein
MGKPNMSARTPPLSQPASGLGTLDEIRKGEGATSLRLSFEGGTTVVLCASLLWLECRSAEGVLRRLGGVPAPENLTITALQAVGDYAINIAFSDGELRGIYPFSFLADLAARQLCAARAAA